MAARADDTGGGQKSGGMLRIVGVVVLALAAVGFGAVRMGFLHLPGSTSEDAVLSKPQDAPADAGSRTAPTTAATKPGGSSSTVGGGVDLDAPATEPPAASRRPGTRAASSGGSGSALVTAVSPEPVSPVPVLQARVSLPARASNPSALVSPVRSPAWAAPSR